jgi:leucyl aminopeptidase
VSFPIDVVEADALAEVATLGVLALSPDGEGPPRLLAAETLSAIPSGLDADECARENFEAKVGQVFRIGATGPNRVLAVGLGKESALDPERYRRAAAAFVRATRSAAALVVPPDAPGAALAEGGLLAGYRFDAYRSAPKPGGLDRLVLVAPAGTSSALRAQVAQGAAAADAVAFARDLVNTPPSDLDPEAFAARVLERLEGRPGVDVEVWDEQRIEEERLGGLHTVARGSSRPPRLVMARYRPERAALTAVHVVLVGKGITFDSGGLSLKTAAGMMTMKTDMSGAAAVMAAVSACGELGVEAAVTAIAMVTENMPGPNAVKPGDVFRARNGLTVEVLNTDAEGRLVLADGLSLAAELEPDAIVDVATLTGAQVVALGRGIGALFGNDQELIDGLAAAGASAGEPLWPMPLPEDYADDIDSEIADMKNMGRADREAGAIAAAMLLSRFVGDTPWAHLDIAGPARAAESSGYLVRGGTGFGVRALLGYLRARTG